jgi:outer membrane protein OmpA-like peptidoglycan-associated protein
MDGQFLGLTNSLTSQLGVTSEQASAGVGSMLNYAKGKLSPEQWSTVSKSIPGADSYLNSASKALGSGNSFLGASESSMKGAVGAALPALLGGVMQKASTPSGAAELMKLLNTPGLDAGIAGNLGSYLGGGKKTSGLLSMGSGLLSSLFGDKLGSLINTIASTFGLKSASASNLMALAAPMVLGFLKTQVSQNRLDAKGLASLLAGQAEFLKPRLDSRITSALGFASPMAFLSGLAGSAGRAADAAGAAVGRAADSVGAAAGRAYDTAGAYGTAAAAATRPVFLRWLPWIILGAIALILLPQLQYCGEQATKKVGDTVGDAAKATGQAAKDAARATADAAKAGATVVTKAIKSFTLPNGVKIDATDGGFVAQLVAFLSSKEAALGQGFSFDEVYFDTGSATIRPESTKQLEHVAVVLKAFPQAAIRVEGHTDNTGDAVVNKQLSSERAAAVEKALKGLGVPDTQISSVGYGLEKPIASNDSDEGRARNRRVDVVVLKR